MWDQNGLRLPQFSVASTLARSSFLDLSIKDLAEERGVLKKKRRQHSFQKERRE